MSTEEGRKGTEDVGVGDGRRGSVTRKAKRVRGKGRHASQGQRDAEATVQFDMLMDTLVQHFCLGFKTQQVIGLCVNDT